MIDAHGYVQASEAARFISRRWSRRPRVAIILGSGLGEVVQGLKRARRIAYRAIPHFPRPGVEGHAGTLHLALWREVPVAVLEGRSHLYEGIAPAEVVFPVRVLTLAGVETFILTCAAGGIAASAAPGSLMVFSDHLNLQGSNPLVGLREPRWGTTFVDLSEAYDPELRSIALRAARGLRLRCFAGVYASVLGPSFETPAEIRALRRLGADAVGMSTVPEVIAARQMGARVLALASITNRAAGLGRQALNHNEVLQAGKKAAGDLRQLLDRILARLAPF